MMTDCGSGSNDEEKMEESIPNYPLTKKEEDNYSGFGMKKPLQIAIDGPVAAGKSTVAKLLSEQLDLLYIDTGAMYRATALAALERGVDWNDEVGLVRLLARIVIELRKPAKGVVDGRKVTVLLDGRDVSLVIRTQEIGEGASVVSQYKEVRKILVKRQQELASGQRVVMEGRDIALRVLPQAHLKIFMTAEVEKRVKWKMHEQAKLGQKLPEAEVRRALVKRDEREMTRKIDPLRPIAGAWVLDTSELTVDEVVRLIVSRVRDWCL